MRLLIISHDIVGTHMAGPGIRYWEIARTLAAEHTVTVITPHAVDVQPDTFSCGSYTWGDAGSLAPWLHEADVILANGFVLEGHPELTDIEQPLVLDLYDPTLLENLELYRNGPAEQRQARNQHDSMLLARQLTAGDFFLCASERQRDLYIGSLMVQGVITPARTDEDPQLRQLIDVLPSGVSPEPPHKQQPALRGVVEGIGDHDPLLLWTGGLWDWMDPLTLIAAMPPVIEQHPDVRLVFLAGKHPGQAHQMKIPAEAKTKAASLGLLNRHIFFYEQWVPYAQRADFLLEATIAVTLHRDHLETRYAALRSRILDHLWAALPSVVSAGDPAATLLHEAGAGLVVPPEQPDDLSTALNRLLGDADLRATQAEAARSLAKTFTWDEVVEPLARFCQNPRRIRPTSEKTTEQTPAEKTATAPDANATLAGQEELLEACRNAALGVQEKTWRLQEQSLGPGRINHLRRVLIDQIVRPFLAPFIEQQQAYNTAVLRSMYAMNETNDYRRSKIIDTINHHFHVINERLNLIDQHLDLLRESISDVANRTQTLEHFSQAITEHVQALEAFVRRVEQDMYEKVLNPLHEHSLSLQKDLSLLHERTAEQHGRIERIKENDMRTRQQLYDMTEQLAGLEDADSLLAALLHADSNGEAMMLPMTKDLPPTHPASEESADKPEQAGAAGEPEETETQKPAPLRRQHQHGSLLKQSDNPPRKHPPRKKGPENNQKSRRNERK